MFKTLRNLLAGARQMQRRRPGQGAAVVPPATDESGAAEKHWLAGCALFGSGDYAAAARALERAVAVQHDFAEAHYLLGLAHRELGAREDAVDCLVLATHFKPELAEAHFHLGLLAAEQGRHREAIASHSRAIEANEGYAEAYNARAASRLEAGDLDAAVTDFRRALQLKPDFHQAHGNLGCVLITRLDRFDEGAMHIETAWRLAPEDRDVVCNWAMLLQYRGRLAESLALCDRLIENNAGADTARLNRALALLKQGNFARGWPDYEARKRVTWEYVPRDFPFPAWKGEPLAGRNVVVHAEQGLGDQIMFASCIPDLERLAAHCVVECAPKLEALFRRSFPVVTVVTTEEIAAGGQWLKKVPAIDFHVAIGSLPQYFRKSLAEFPAHDGYLRADPGKIATWRKRLAGLPGARKVGISWRGGMKSSRQSVRSIPLDQWLSILGQGDAAFVSLQYTDCQAELAQLERDHGIRIHHWQEAIDDYDETAALVCALDLVISVQTAIAHLGGALGRPVWVMVPAVAEWRYQQSGDSLPWYPSLRLFRQGEPGGWSPVVGRVARELEGFKS